MNTQLERLTNQARFVQMIIDGKLIVAKKKKRDLVKELQEKNFKPFPKIVVASQDDVLVPPLVDLDSDEEFDPFPNAFDYLLGVRIK